MIEYRIWFRKVMDSFWTWRMQTEFENLTIITNTCDVKWIQIYISLELDKWFLISSHFSAQLFPTRFPSTQKCCMLFFIYICTYIYEKTKDQLSRNPSIPIVQYPVHFKSCSSIQISTQEKLTYSLFIICMRMRVCCWRWSMLSGCICSK